MGGENKKPDFCGFCNKYSIYEIAAIKRRLFPLDQPAGYFGMGLFIHWGG
jgi:hypothetical protein